MSSSLASNLSSSIKQQPFSPTSFNSYSNDFYNQHHHHRSMTVSSENEKVSQKSNHIPETSSTSNVASPSTTGKPVRGSF